MKHHSNRKMAGSVIMNGLVFEAYVKACAVFRFSREAACRFDQSSMNDRLGVSKCS